MPLRDYHKVLNSLNHALKRIRLALAIFKKYYKLTIDANVFRQVKSHEIFIAAIQLSRITNSLVSVTRIYTKIPYNGRLINAKDKLEILLIYGSVVYEALISTTRFKSFAFRRTALACKDIGNGISARSSFGLRYQVSHHMGDEIPLPGTAGRDSATGAGANTANMHESRRRHNTRKHRKGSCAYTGIGTADTSASEAGPVYQGTLIKIDPRGVSAFAQEVLGPAYVGERIFLLHGRSCHRGNNT